MYYFVNNSKDESICLKFIIILLRNTCVLDKNARPRKDMDAIVYKQQQYPRFEKYFLN